MAVPAASKSAPPPVRSRPEAPAFSFGPSSSRPPGVVAAAPVRARPSAPDRHATAPGEALPGCSTCGAQNPAGYRYCVSCGAGMPVPRVATPSAEPAPVLPAAEPVRPPPPESERGEMIIGAPVVGIASARRVEAPLVTCTRCHGQCAAGTRFCKFCGAPLGDVAAMSRPQVVDAGARPSVDSSPRSAAGDAPLARRLVEPDPRAEVAQPLAHRIADPVPHPRPSSPARDPRPSAASSGVDRGSSGRSPARLVIIVEDGSEGARFPLLPPQIDVGRTEGDIRLDDDPYVSPRHARLLFENGVWSLRDLGSTNGVYVRLRRPHALRDADLLLLGLEVLQFEAVNDGERGLGHAVQHGTLLFGSPATPRHARLRQRTVEGIARDIHHLVRDETVIGREMGDIVFTNDPFLSRRHAAIRRNAATGEFSIEDLDSSNGTYVGIRRDLALSNGDFVRIGQHLFRVDLDQT